MKVIQQIQPVAATTDNASSSELVDPLAEVTLGSGDASSEEQQTSVEEPTAEE